MQAQLYQETAESCGQLSCKHLHGWRFHNLSRQPVPEFDHSPGRSYFPGTEMEFPRYSFWSQTLVLPLHTSKKSQAVFSTPPIRQSYKLPALNSPLRMKQKYSLHLYLCIMCSAPLTFMVIHWICSTLSMPPSRWGAQNGTESSRVK